ncbi:energy transducer TonB [candidate division WOR-3 bacterium]|nr:energy transducer TonB [candidate division WOR-3 bacterium]
MKNVIVLAITSIVLCLCITCSSQAPVMAYDDVEVKPKPISLPKPVYPEQAKNQGIQGDILTKVLVGADGRIEQAMIQKSSSFEILDNAALEAVQAAMFKPARHGDKPVRVWVSIPIRFTLTDHHAQTPTDLEKDPNIIAYHIVDVKPTPVNIVKPEYPEQARKNGIEGRTVVRALIEFDGSISATEVYASSGDESLDNAALSAVKQSVFEPASHAGKPVKVWVSIPIQFKLSG